MSDCKIEFTFNTALVALPEETGALDEKAFRQQVLPLRGQIMKIDGVCGCYIARYGVEVNFLDNVTSRQVVIAGVEAVIVWAAEQDFFPMRGEKVPEATAKPVPVSTTATWWVARVRFDTDLFTNLSKKHTRAIRAHLHALLENADGARDTHVGQRTLSIMFDERITSPEDMKEHLAGVVANIMGDRDQRNYFPFENPTFTYETGRTNFVI